MTIEEYLRKRIEDLEEGPCNSSLVQGKVLAYREILSKLPEFDHEVTLREVKEECDKHGGEEGCYGCVLLREPKFPSRNYCAADCSPNALDIADIQRRMKEARND